jgi:hypothetical protein
LAFTDIPTANAGKIMKSIAFIFATSSARPYALA